MESDNIDIEKLIATRANNNKVAWMMADYINNTPRQITPPLIDELKKDYQLDEDFLYRILLFNFMGLDIEANKSDSFIAEKYLQEGITRLSATEYISNPYYTHIAILEETTRHWQLTYDEYKPYEAFIYRDISLLDDYTEIPHLGYFEKSFRFPLVKQDGREWMAIKPNEIETMKAPLNEIKGKVITFGLGLGYFTFMASQKENVSDITVIELDKEVINLFNQYILPQFNHPEKVHIIQADAFDFMQHQLPKLHLDYAFVDLWHDAADGLNMYLKAKKLEYLSPETHFLYWIEETLLSALRWNIFEEVVHKNNSVERIEQLLSDNHLRKLAGSIRM